ncbi:unnamed protein product [Auanema sp. JU1783]|nr:unnamed protein product [Auanema sp. JU1783]
MRKRSMYKSISRDATSYTSSVDASSQIDNSPRFIGEIQLRLTYNSSNSSLNVHVMQCRSLPHYGQHRPNPYVKIFLIGEYTTDMSQKYKTAPKKSAVDPLFNEIIKIPNVNRNHLNNHRLLVGVWHHDALGHNSPIGETIIALNSYDWKSIQSLWYPIEAKAVVSDRFQPKVLSNTPEPSTIFSIDRSRARLRPSNSLPSDYQMASNSTGYPLSYSNMSPDQVLLQRTEIINSGQSWATSRSNSDNFRNIRELEREHKKSKYQRPSFEEPESVDSGTDWTIWI